MYECLAKFVVAQPEDKIGQISLEDMALCTAWYHSYENDPEKIEQYANFPDVLDQWVSNVTQREGETEGFRQQPLLRNLIRQLDVSGVDKMSPGAIEFLFFASALIQRTDQDELFARPIKCITPHNDILAKRRTQCRGEPGLPSLAEYITLFGREDLITAKSREINTFAGIAIAFRGPVATHKGDLKIIGDIPEECTVVVEGGSCYISGAVFGNLAATDYCEVFENIAGTVIARKGSVRAARIINQATVISKEGDVHCTEIQDAKIVFACNELKVKNSTLGSILLAREINIGQETVGGIIHTSHAATAAHFRKTDQRRLSIVLRRTLNCNDYGETLAPDAARLLAQARKLHNQHLDVQALELGALREADDYAGTTLLFILGDMESDDQLKEIQRMKRRVAYLNRLDLGTQALIRTIEARLSIGVYSEDAQSDSDSLPLLGDETSIIHQLQEDLMALQREGPIDNDVRNQKEDIAKLGRALQSGTITRKGILVTLKNLLLKMEQFNQMQHTTEEFLLAKERALEVTAGRQTILENAREEHKRIGILNQILKASRSRTSNNMLKRRANDRYVKLMLRNVENRQGRVSTHRNRIRDIKERITNIQNKLWEEFQVPLPPEILGAEEPEVSSITGNFEAGIWLCSYRHQLDHCLPGERGVVWTEDSAGTRVCYRRTTQGTIEAEETDVL